MADSGGPTYFTDVTVESIGGRIFILRDGYDGGEVGGRLQGFSHTTAGTTFHVVTIAGTRIGVAFEPTDSVTIAWD